MWRACKQGIKTGIKQWRIAFVVYVVQALLAWILGLQVVGVVEGGLGSSLEYEKLVQGYDHTVYLDFMDESGNAMGPLWTQLNWLILVYGLISIFLHAGVLLAIQRQDTSISNLWEGGTKYFLPFLKIAVLIMLIFLVWSAALILPPVIHWVGAIEALPSEVVYFALMGGILAIWFLGTALLFTASVFARLRYITAEESVWKAIRYGFSRAIRTYFSSSTMVIVASLFLAVLAGGYLLIEHKSGMVSSGLVLLFVGLQQLLVLIRISWRIMVYGGLNALENSQ